MQEYYIQFYYKQGVDNIVAGALSHLPITEESNKEKSVMVLEISSTNATTTSAFLSLCDDADLEDEFIHLLSESMIYLPNQQDHPFKLNIQQIAQAHIIDPVLEHLRNNLPQYYQPQTLYNQQVLMH